MVIIGNGLRESSLSIGQGSFSFVSSNALEKDINPFLLSAPLGK